MSNPYHPKDLQGNHYNQEFQIWEEGRRAGIKEVVEYIEKKHLMRPEREDIWEAKLKEWLI